MVSPMGVGEARKQIARGDGQALIELALVLPLILIILFGVVDFGKAFNYQNDETNLANEAARYAVVGNCGAGCASIVTAVKNDADSGDLKNGGGSISSPGVSVSLCFPSGSGALGEPVRATVSANYNWLSYLVSKAGLSPTVPIVARATMRMEHTYAAGTDPFTPVSPCP